MFRFIKYFIYLLAFSYQAPKLKKLSDEIPVTTTTAEKLLQIDNLGIVEYVVCPKCHSVYDYENCVVTLRSGKKESKTCCFVKYPSHPHPSKRLPCNTLLLKTVNNKLVPFVTCHAKTRLMRF